MTDTHESEKNDGAPEQQPEPEPSIVDSPTPDAEAQFVAETSARSRHTRRRWAIIAGVIAVALVTAVGAYALWRNRPAPPVRPPATVSVTTTAPQADSATATTPQPPASAAGTMAPGGSSSEASSSAPGQVRPRGSAGNPAADGAPLGEIARPPERTIGMLVVPKGFTIASYGVVFRPYGWGPGGESGGRLLVKIVSSKATNASATSLKKNFAGRNVSVWCTPKAVAAVSGGGTFQGVLQVRPQGDVGVLYLAQARRVK